MCMEKSCSSSAACRRFTDDTRLQLPVLLDTSSLLRPSRAIFSTASQCVVFAPFEEKAWLLGAEVNEEYGEYKVENKATQLLSFRG